ncbi:MAG: 60S ribosomal protein L22 [Candidatus Bathyarchaeota archaeon]|nr:MAG: 60S ribosomal protein L22 [Candidatus Bathyarchaeota archaeon]
MARTFTTIVIKISELRGENGENVKDLAEFLEDKVNAKTNIAGSEITLNYEDKGEVPSKTYLRVLLRKFLHKAELKEDFRVISGKGNVFIIKERKI